jgi:hypothetical protein
VAGKSKLLQIRLSEALTKISLSWQRHAFFLQLFQTLQTGPPPHLNCSPAIKTVIMASEETIPIIVEFT